MSLIEKWHAKTDFRAAIWSQFGAAIDMLENAVHACPEELWSNRTRNPEYWRLVYHTLFWLDCYLSGSTEGFALPPPLTLDEREPDAPPPIRAYTKNDLRVYLEYCRSKCKATIAEMTEREAARRHSFIWGEVSFAELLLYNMRHVQHGAAQLNLILRQVTNSAPGWVGRPRA